MCACDTVSANDTLRVRMQVDALPFSVGYDVHKSSELLRTSNARFDVTCYWKDGTVVSELPPKAPTAIRFAYDFLFLVEFE